MQTIDYMQPSVVVITDRAAAKLYEILLEKNNLNLKLRVEMIENNGRDMQFDFAFEEEKRDDDFVIERKLNSDIHTAFITLLFDPITLSYLDGAEIDFVHDPQIEHFVIRNVRLPKNSCRGCDGSCGGCGGMI